MSDDPAATTEFPERLGTVATRQLAIHGVTRHEQLTTLTRARLLTIHGVGPRALRILAEELATRGLSFADG